MSELLRPSRRVMNLRVGSLPNMKEIYPLLVDPPMVGEPLLLGSEFVN